MTATDSFLSFWYFHVPNLALAALMYTLLGRFLQSLVFESDAEATIWRVFKTVTEPVMGVVRLITPRLVPERIVILFAAVWALLARRALLIALARSGVAPKIAG
jgi:YggT family protein